MLPVKRRMEEHRTYLKTGIFPTCPYSEGPEEDDWQLGWSLSSVLIEPGQQVVHNEAGNAYA